MFIGLPMERQWRLSRKQRVVSGNSYCGPNKTRQKTERLFWFFETF